LENTVTQRPAAANDSTRGPWTLAAFGLALFALAWGRQGDEQGYWLPGLGLGIVLIAWVGWRIMPALAAVLLLVRALTHADDGATLVLVDSALHIALIGLSWWLYFHVARGSRWLDDPNSATLFLILVPGGLSAFTALAQAGLWIVLKPGQDLMMLAAQLWLSRMVGILVIVPASIVVGTPMLLRHGFVSLELPPSFFGEQAGLGERRGERIELAGLTFATAMLALLLLWTRLNNPNATWMLWAVCLVLIVWTCIRQGLKGGCLSAFVTSILVLAAAQVRAVPADMQPAIQAAIQGNLLAFCSSALLVGVSASWIRATETRFRHVVSRIPFVVYSARLPYGIPSIVPSENGVRKSDSKLDFHAGPSISKLANVMLVSPASRQVLGCEPEALLGPFARWLERIEPADHVMVIAALAQLCLQKQPVACEYRLRATTEATLGGKPAAGVALAGPERWVRDTLAPHYSEHGLVDGWEGLIEDITDQRLLSHNLRRLSNMLQVLVTNLPCGVYFVQAPEGYPILVNARARQLLGQREDLSSGLGNLSRVYRLHRPDGADYPAEELPVAKALRQGVACRANDIVVHRADGRKTPLITWAAPIDLHNKGATDAAVWVMEDWSAMQQAENALRESELRLRAIIETMGEGVIVQDNEGTIIDCNPAASVILGIPRDRLMHQAGLIPGADCLQGDGAPFPRREQPDQVALRDHRPARDVILGQPLPPEGNVRWLLVHSVPLPVGPSAGLNHQRARVVTTFADVTQQREVQDSLRLAKDKYEKLVETLPFILIQRNAHGEITYVNPAVTQLTGHTPAELMTPGHCQTLLHPDDVPAYQAALADVSQGQAPQIELRFRAKDGSFKTALALYQPQCERGEVVGSTCLLIDISKQRQLEQELLHAKHLELVGRLASGTVHDFNNLLTVMMGLAGLAKTELAADHPAWQHLERIEEVGAQAATLAGQLLTFSKQRPKEYVPIDLNAVVTQTLKIARSVIPEAVSIDSMLDPSNPMVQGDENQLRQVLMNLCLNARDAMTQGGSLTVRTDRAPPPDSEGKTWVHVAIADTGHGMDEQVRTRIFEPFFSTKERGTGLGLAVVQHIVSEFGGRIAVTSAPGKGTRFDLWLVSA
jgi:PAS domain S-box-containing protein